MRLLRFDRNDTFYEIATLPSVARNDIASSNFRTIPFYLPWMEKWGLAPFLFT